jgi:hypothetical protein
MLKVALNVVLLASDHPFNGFFFYLTGLCVMNDLNPLALAVGFGSQSAEKQCAFEF